MYTGNKKLKSLDKKNTADILALTPLQEGLLFHYLKVPESEQYLEQLSLDISGAVDTDCFEKAWNVVVETNEMLRTLFRWEKMKSPMQVVLKKHRLQPVYHDFSGKDTASDERNRLLAEVKVNDRKTNFDLREVPFRVTLCKLEEAKYVMIISNHHILYDGWSNGIILKEFFAAYNELSNGKEPVRPRKRKFKEFIRRMQDRDARGEEEFWKAYLEGIDTQTELVIKRKKEKEITSTGRRRVRFAREVKDKLENFVKKSKVTVSSVLYSAWGLLLQKYNNSEDVIFGATVSGRSTAVKGIEEVVGLFINTLPLRVQTRGREKIGDLLYRLDRSVHLRETFENSPLTAVKEYGEWSTAEEIFDSIVVVENYPLDSRLKQEQGKISLDSYSMVEMTHYDLTVSIAMFDGMVVDFIYNQELFAVETIERLSGHFGRIVRDIIKYPGKEFYKIEILSAKEKKQLVVDFNNTGVDYLRDKALHRLFAEQAERTPDRIALVDPNPKSEIRNPKQIQITKIQNSKHHLTYKELNKKSNQLAGYLREQGTGERSIVGLMVERSLEMIIGILGILKTGGAYLPIDPKQPVERIHYMLADTNARILLKKSESPLRGHPIENPNDKKSNDQNNIFACTVSNFEFRALNLSSSELAYIIFTSGSTGNPKGVPITHANLSPLLHWGYKQLALSTGDRAVQNLSYYFDWSVWEIFITLTSGAGLYLVPEEILLDAEAYIHFMNKNRITVLHITPTQFGYLVNSQLNLETLKYLFIGAEKLTYDLVERSFEVVNDDCRVFNMYGPTEASIISAVLEIDGKGYGEFKKLSGIPIGIPIANTNLFILDNHLNLCPVGIPGELYISGDGLARGYLNSP